MGSSGEGSGGELLNGAVGMVGLSLPRRNFICSWPRIGGVAISAQTFGVGFQLRGCLGNDGLGRDVMAVLFAKLDFKETIQPAHSRSSVAIFPAAAIFRALLQPANRGSRLASFVAAPCAWGQVQSAHRWSGVASFPGAA